MVAEVSERLLLTEEEAADRLLVSTRTLRRLRQDGEIRYVALAGRRIAYRIEDCLNYIENHLRVDEPAPMTRPAPKSVGKRRNGNIIPFSARQGARG